MPQQGSTPPRSVWTSRSEGLSTTRNHRDASILSRLRAPCGLLRAQQAEVHVGRLLGRRLLRSRLRRHRAAAVNGRPVGRPGLKACRLGGARRRRRRAVGRRAGRCRTCVGVGDARVGLHGVEAGLAVGVAHGRGHLLRHTMLVALLGGGESTRCRSVAGEGRQGEVEGSVRQRTLGQCSTDTCLRSESPRELWPPLPLIGRYSRPVAH